MTTTDDPGATPPVDDLQFEHAEFTSTPAPMPTVLSCEVCKRQIDDAYYELSRKVLCERCRDHITAHFNGGSGPMRFLRAGVYGTLAGLGGTALYCLVWVLTGGPFSLIAIVIGFMVGSAVRKGAGYRGGLPFQLLAV